MMPVNRFPRSHPTFWKWADGPPCVRAAAGDTKTYSPFELGARITEVGMLGVLALRLQKPITWDAEKRQATGLPEADAIIDPKPATDVYLPRSLVREILLDCHRHP